MANSLLTGISGLRGHQKMLEVIGNNLANVNTTAFKASRILFSDLMYEGQRGASSGNGSALGSINPLEIGTGSQVASVDLNFTQGNLESTGEALDAAIDGGGFFVVRTGDNTLFTRAGAFSIDESGNLVDASTGYLVQRFGTVGETSTIGPAFQTPGDDRIQVPIGASIPGAVTSDIQLRGALTSAATGPLAQVVRSPSYETSSGAATATTLLNDLTTTAVSYQPGDELLVSGTLADSTPVDFSISVDGSTDIQDIIDGIAAEFVGSTVTFAAGQITVTSNTTGVSSLGLSISDHVGNTGRSNGTFLESYTKIVEGAEATVVRGSIPVFDERGAENTIQYSLTKQVDESWTLEVTVDPTVGTVEDGLVEGIRFQDNGSFAQVSGTLLGDSDIVLRFASSNNSQAIRVGFGTPGKFDGLAEIGTEPSIAFDVDGYSPGELASVQIDSDGTVSAVASNGINFPIAQLAIASFRNPDGLQSAGSNYYGTSLASGNPEIGTALSGDRGAIRAGQLEGSNVDLALEFTRLLVAQRGFSANARTITVTDEVLEELTNIIR